MTTFTTNIFYGKELGTILIQSFTVDFVPWFMIGPDYHGMRTLKPGGEDLEYV